MNWRHLHGMINHFPVILAMMGTLAALLGLVVRRRGVWLYASASLTIAGISVVPTYFSGPQVEHALNHPWYVERGAIHAHETWGLYATLLVGLAALVAAFVWRRLIRYPRETSLPGIMRGALLLTSLAATAAIFYTSTLGGEIVHDSPVLLGPRPAGVTAPAPMTGRP